LNIFRTEIAYYTSKEFKTPISFKLNPNSPASFFCLYGFHSCLITLYNGITHSVLHCLLIFELPKLIFCFLHKFLSPYTLCFVNSLSVTLPPTLPVPRQGMPQWSKHSVSTLSIPHLNRPFQCYTHYNYHKVKRNIDTIMYLEEAESKHESAFPYLPSVQYGPVHPGVQRHRPLPGSHRPLFWHLHS